MFHYSLQRNQKKVKGRFAPSPSGRMHLGNIFTALISWLSAKSKGGTWLLRIEDLDPQRSKQEYARQIENDLLWLGLEWDEGGLDNKGLAGPYSQSMRSDEYEKALDSLRHRGLLYPCYCTRADIMATQAPHESDGRIVYRGTCRNAPNISSRPAATRIMVPDVDIPFDDRVFGHHTVNLSAHCGDFVLRRADGAWAYQLAVVVDDALMGVTEVVRGCDLLLSTAQQLFLYSALGAEPPEFAHLPLICNSAGQRLSKRDSSMSMEALRHRFSPEELIGRLAHMAGITDEPSPVKPHELITLFDWTKIPSVRSIAAHCLEEEN
ncbi:MAG: tRNA glutamyl-Q(34) synthetase GluQRS [Muribaculaceae bacterium]|nr:tRNA glutamyl-Q(34) synthetase GluQRS [Muribaculaceae bacterium]